MGRGVREVKQRRRTIRLAGALILASTVSGCTATVATALPAGRHYEMVSPPYKGGYSVTPGVLPAIVAVAPAGEAAVYGSVGAFEGAPADHVFNLYVAHRDPLYGWKTVPLGLPASIAPYTEGSSVVDFSSGLEESLFYGQLGPNSGASQFENTESEFLLHPTYASDTAADFEPAGEVIKVPPGTFLNYRGASSDLSHVVMEPSDESGTLALTPEGAGAVGQLYDIVSRGDGEHTLRFVDLNNEVTPKAINPGCVVHLGAFLNEHGGRSTFNAIAANGQEIFFWTGVVSGSGCSGDEQLFVRLNGSRTLEISRPLEAGLFGGCVGEVAPHVTGEVPCQGSAVRARSEFAGASEDGSRVFFMTKARLEPKDDTDLGNDLYMAGIGCATANPTCTVSDREVISLTQVSHDPHAGQAAEVQGVVSVSPDGSRVYFVARGVLSGGNAEGASPVEGADNLYTAQYDENAKHWTTEFIADLCSEAAVSGDRPDSHCPTSLNDPHRTITRPYIINTRVSDETLWNSIDPEVQMASDGRFLVFSSYGELTRDDTDNAKDVFRYDAQSGMLVRVSVGEVGYKANGNGEDESSKENDNAESQITPQKISEMAHPSVRAGLKSRAVSEDGSRIVFVSSEPLSADATNGLVNAYEWHGGSVSLVSTGNDEQPVEDVVITQSGGDVFFTTVQRLTPQDTDEVADLYDARLGAGFAASPASSQACSGDACQGPLTNPAPLFVPSSVSQAAGENLPPPKVSPKKKPKRKRKPKMRRNKGRRALRKRGGGSKANLGAERR